MVEAMCNTTGIDLSKNGADSGAEARDTQLLLIDQARLLIGSIIFSSSVTLGRPHSRAVSKLAVNCMESVLPPNGT